MTSNPTDNKKSSEDINPSSTGVSFSNEPADLPAYRKQASAELKDFNSRASLSASAKAWDLDGDGELDDAEMALRNMDRSHKGTLSKEQMYELMNSNLKTQRELFKVKKVVMGLVAFTCILAISNLGTSLAAAFLAKDTKTVDGNFVDSNTGKTLKTDSSATTFNVDKELTERNRRQRRLACNEVDGELECNAEALNAVSLADGVDIANACVNGGTVDVDITFAGYGAVCHRVCQITQEGHSSSHGVLGVDGGMTDGYPWFKVTHSINGETFVEVEIKPNDDATAYVILGMHSVAGEGCNVDADCSPNSSLTCVDNVCTL